MRWRRFVRAAFPPLAALVALAQVTPSARATDLQHLYWADTVAHEIRRANLDGSAVEDMLSNVVTEPFEIALDAAAAKLYWVDRDNGRIRRSNLDGSEAEDVAVGSFDGRRRSGLVVDTMNGRLYWWRETPAETSVLHTLYRASLDGSGAEALLSLSSDIINFSFTPVTLDLDAAGGGKLYWSDRHHQIWRADLDGTEIEEILSEPGPFVPLPSRPALDGAGKLYWAEGIRRRVRRANLDGSGIEVLVETAGQTGEILVDPVAGKLYWMQAGNPGNPSEVYRSNLDGSQVEVVATTTTIFPTRLTFDAAARELYWSAGARIQRASLDGPAAEDFVDGLGDVAYLALDETTGQLYWADRLEGRIQRTPADSSGPVEDLHLRTLLAPHAIALDPAAGHIYWTETGRVRRALLEGNAIDAATIEDLITGLTVAHGVAVDPVAGKLYWTNNHQDIIERADLDGSNRELVHNTLGPKELVVDPPTGEMYWVYGYRAGGHQGDRGGVRRSELDGGLVEDLVQSYSDLAGGIALDPVGEKVYWTDERARDDPPPAGQASTKVQRANLDGTEVEDLLTGGLVRPTGIAVDPAAGTLYWADASTGTISRANLDGSEAEEVVSGLAAPHGLLLAPEPSAWTLQASALAALACVARRARSWRH